jgi:AcrR family transcriptional regulator
MIETLSTTLAEERMVRSTRGKAAAAEAPEGLPAEKEDKHGTKARMILLAAARIFNERGYHETSMADVAQALGVSKPFLYYYLKNKEDILYECSRLATEELHAMLDEVRRSKVDGWDRLVLLFRGYARVMTTDFGICLIRNTAPGSLPDTGREKLWVGRRRLNREVEQIIAQGIADGSIRPSDPITLSFAMFGAFNWMTAWYRPDGPLSAEEIADRFLDVFAHGAKLNKAART